MTKRDRHIPRVCHQCSAPLGGNDLSCWRCGAPWIVAPGPPTRPVADLVPPLPTD